MYRLVDSYNERPVFKQDMGENYIYYSLAGQSWVLGCQVCLIIAFCIHDTYDMMLGGPHLLLAEEQEQGGCRGQVALPPVQGLAGEEQGQSGVAGP